MGVEPLISLAGSIFAEGINEVIVTTCNNAAPMGIIRKNNSLSMIVFKASHTAKNIISGGWIVAHITHDPILFVRTAFDDLPVEAFVQEHIEDLTVYRLSDIPDWVVLRATVLNVTAEKVFVNLFPVHAEIVQAYPNPVHRGLNNIIEATVHGTRFILNQDPTLRDLIHHHGELVMRCGGGQDKKALNLLYSYINKAVPGSFGTSN